MTRPIDGPFTARIEGDFVVFLIGMRINKPWKIGKWWPVFIGMPRMLKELKAAGPESGFLGHTPLSMTLIAQYWRSYEHLEAYARSKDARHWPAWVAFNRRMKNARTDVGIWHETYKIRAGEYESIYSGMPPFGLSAAVELVRLGQKSTARDRLAGHLE
ncbi:MAG: DUF4188 domain-containing protein [Hyphomicrobiaceae bacterium]